MIIFAVLTTAIMKYKLNTTFEIWDFNNPEKELPKDLQRAYKGLSPMDFIHMFGDVHAFGGYVSTPNGGSETDDFGIILTFKVYQEDDALFDYISDEGDEPDYIEVAINAVD